MSDWWEAAPLFDDNPKGKTPPPGTPPQTRGRFTSSAPGSSRNTAVNWWEHAPVVPYSPPAAPGDASQPSGRFTSAPIPGHAPAQQGTGIVRSPMQVLQNFIPHPTEYPGEVKKELTEGSGQIIRGGNQVAYGSGKDRYLYGPGNLVGGMIRSAYSPISGAINTAIANPVEKGTGSHLLGQLAGTGALLVSPTPSAVASRLREVAKGFRSGGIGGAVQGFRGAEPMGRVGGALLNTPAAQAGARVANQIGAPENLGPAAARAGAMINEHTGQAARETAKAMEKVRPFEVTADKLPHEDRVNFIDYMQGHMSDKDRLPAAVHGMADEMKARLEDRAKKLKEAGVLNEFQREYFPNRWSHRPGEALDRQWLGKPQKMSFREGLGAGFVPRTTNPYKIYANYISTADRILAKRKMLEVGKDEGFIKYFKPGEEEFIPRAADSDVIGTVSRAIPKGWVELDQGFKPPPAAMRHYAEPGWAKVYNRYVSTKGLEDIISKFPGASEEGAANAVKTLTYANNAMVAADLGFSGYHMIAETKEALASSVALAESQLLGKGQRLKGLDTIMKTPLAPVGNYLRGKQMEQIYKGAEKPITNWLDKSFLKFYGGTSPETQEMTRKIVDLGTRAGGRFSGGRAHSMEEYSFGRAGASPAAKRAIDVVMDEGMTVAIRSTMGQMKKAVADMVATARNPSPVVHSVIRQSGEITKTLAGDLYHHLFQKMLQAASGIARVMDTIAYPLFEKLIPRMKAGAYFENMAAWLHAHPGASEAEELKIASLLMDSIENRYGEMVKDRILMTRATKQALQIGTVSFSYSLGTAREFGGGMLDLVKGRSLAITSPNWSPKAAYALAYPIVDSLLNVGYQFLKTGQTPHGIEDLISPRTGGTDEHGQPERVYPIGNMKDLHEWFTGFRAPTEGGIDPMAAQSKSVTWLGNKASPLLRDAWAISQNEGWQENHLGPIVGPDAVGSQAVFQALEFPGDSLKPIPFQNLTNAPEGTKITPMETFLGFRTAGDAYTGGKGKRYHELQAGIDKALAQGDVAEAQRLAAEDPYGGGGLANYLKHKMYSPVVQQRIRQRPSSSAGGVQ
jgi:hypothetical protein